MSLNAIDDEQITVVPEYYCGEYSRAQLQKMQQIMCVMAKGKETKKKNKQAEI